MSLGRLIILSLGLTLLSIVFVETNADFFGGIFWQLLLVQDVPAAWAMTGMLVLGGCFLSKRFGNGAWIDVMLAAIDRRRMVLALGLWVGLCAASIWIYRSHPLSMDEYAVLFQAKIFAAGALHGQFPPELLDYLIPRGFQNHFLMVNHTTGAVFSSYWPGYSLLLTPFVWLGIPWACNPALVAASFLLIAKITRELTGSQIAVGWALLFSAASPAFLANGMTYYSMPAHLFFNLAYAWLLFSPTPSRLFLSGLIGGFALVLHNPFPHFVFSIPWIAWLLLRRGARPSDLLWLALGYLPVVALLGVGWAFWQQHVLQPAVSSEVLHVAGEGLPGCSDRLTRLLHGVVRLFRWPDEHVVYRRVGGLVKLWIWAAPVLLLLSWQGGRCENRARVQLLGASALTSFFAYFLISFDQGHGWGYRYFHSAWGVLPILAALGAMKIVSRDGPGVRLPLAAMALSGLVVANGLHVDQMYRFVSNHLDQFPPRGDVGRRIVFHNGRGNYSFDLIQNDPWLRGDETVFLVGNQSEREYLVRHLRLGGGYESHRNKYGEILTLKHACPDTACLKKNAP